MIVTRTLGGTAVKLPPEVMFIEIRSADDKVGAVIFLVPDNGQVRITQPGDVDFETYIRHHQLTSAKLVHLPALI